MFKFKKRESNEEIGRRLFQLSDKKDYGIFASPIDGQTAFDELVRFFLGDNWYSANPISREQINMEALYEIETNYKDKVKKYGKIPYHAS